MKLCVECHTHYLDEGDACPADGTDLLAVGDDPLLGTTIGDKYRILHVLGRGSMGIVYKAVQNSTGREMAVKFLLQPPNASHDQGETIIKRFQREAKTLSSLKHPNIVTLFDFGFAADNKPYLVTEFLYGLTLTQFLRQNGYLDPIKAMPIFEQVCDAVSEAHHHKVVHRDIKPDNIFLQGKDSGGRFIKVLDFGIAKLIDTHATTSLTMDGRVCGSPAYMSPEQCKAIDVDLRCDVYSLGVVIFETLTGRRPFDGDDAMSVMFAHVNEMPPKLSAVRQDGNFSPKLEEVLLRALSKEPGRRQQSIQEFWEDFSSACFGKTRKQGAGWIPFTAPGLRLPAPASREVQADLDALQGRRKDSQAIYLHEFRRKQRLFFIRVGLCMLAGITGYLFFFGHEERRDRMSIETAELLTRNGRPEDEIKILEKMKADHTLSNEDTERLNNAYIQSAIKSANHKHYANAVDTLHKVSSRSHFSEQANELIRKFKHR
jgi:serine/threonine protein kinase